MAFSFKIKYSSKVKCHQDKYSMSSEPQAKKIKLEGEECCGTQLRMECVLDDSLKNDLPMVRVYVGKILDRRNISKIIVQLNDLHPIPELQHLKRIKGGDSVLLCLTEYVKDVKFFLEHIGFDTSTISSDFDEISVPGEAPKTRKQFTEANKCWPCNFHEEKYVEKLVNNDYTEEELELHEKWMRCALDCRGTVIVDPKDNMLKGSSPDLRQYHPMKHSAMVAIDNVARSQGGGAWGLPTGKIIHSKDDEEGPYLCTGYDVYLMREPCILCAMALVHSRVKRVFYSISSKNGALGTMSKLHCVKPLNHHFEVFRGLLQAESLKLNCQENS